MEHPDLELLVARIVASALKMVLLRVKLIAICAEAARIYVVSKPSSVSYSSSGVSHESTYRWRWWRRHGTRMAIPVINILRLTGIAVLVVALDCIMLLSVLSLSCVTACVLLPWH